jgi:hypothetical protein
VADQRDRLGSSGVFKVIVDSARKFKRAVTGGDDELTPEAHAFGDKIAQAFVVGRFADAMRWVRRAFRVEWAASSS